MGSDLDLTIADLLDRDGVAEVADAAVNLDLVLEEFLEGGGVEDLVAGGLRSVDDELMRDAVVSDAVGCYRGGRGGDGWW